MPQGKIVGYMVLSKDLVPLRWGPACRRFYRITTWARLRSATIYPYRSLAVSHVKIHDRQIAGLELAVNFGPLEVIALRDLG